MRYLLFVGLLVSTLSIYAQEKPIFLNGGFIHPETLEPIFETRYSDARFYDDNKLISANRSNRWVLLDYEGMEIYESWNEAVHQFLDNVTIIKSGTFSEPEYIAIDGMGNILFKKKTDAVYSFENGFANFKRSNDENLLGLLDKTGREILPAEYEGIIRSVEIQGENYFIVTKNEKTGVIDSQRREIIPFQYLSILYLDTDLFLMGVLDEENPTSESVWGTTIQNKNFEIRDINNQKRVDRLIEGYQSGSGFRIFDRLLVRFEGNSDWHVIDYSGNILYSYEKSWVQPVSKNLISIGKGREGGYVINYAISDLEGNLKTPFTVASRTNLSMGLIGICIEENNQRGCGYIDENGSLKIPLRYTGFTESFQDDGRAIVSNTLVQQNNYTVQQRGIIDLDGNQILPPIFGSIERVSENYYKASLPNNSHFFLVDANSGEPIGSHSEIEYTYSAYAKYYVSNQQFEKAISYFQKVGDRYLKTEDRYWYAVSLSNMGNYQGANNQYTKVISETEKSDLRALSILNRADNYFEIGRPDLAKQGYYLVLTEQNNDPRIQMRYAAVLEKYQFMTDAISQYQEILKTHSNVAEVHQGLGKVQLIVDQVDESIATLNTAIQLNPNLAESYNFRGQAHIINGDPKKAILDFQKAIELNADPELTTIHIRLASAYEASGEVQKACELWEQLAPYDENSSSIFKSICNQ